MSLSESAQRFLNGERTPATDLHKRPRFESEKKLYDSAQQLAAKMKPEAGTKFLEDTEVGLWGRLLDDAEITMLREGRTNE